MKYTTKANWKTVTKYDNGVILTRPNAKKVALDLGLKVAGAVVCYELGTLIGELMDHIPYINQWVPQAVDFVSGIKVAGNLDGLVGLLSGIYGWGNSGTETFEDNPDKLHTIELSPLKVTLRE